MMVFWYEIKNVFARAKYDSVQYLKEHKDELGIAKLDDVSMGDGDEAFVKKLIKQAAIKVFGMMEPYTHDLANLETPLEGFEWDVTYTDEEENQTQNCVVFRMIETETMSTTILPLMENAIENALVNYAIGKFLPHNNIDGGFFMNEYESNHSDLLGYINRRKGLKRKYKMF